MSSETRPSPHGEPGHGSAAARQLPCPDRALEADDPLVAAARAALVDGQLVALPTETVYGLAARADDPDALRRLDKLKGRPQPGGLTWHVGDGAALEPEFELYPLARRLAERYWPGPLTLVMRPPEGWLAAKGLEHIARDGYFGLRMPAHAGTRSVLAATPAPVVMTSANPSGEAPLGSPAAIAERFGAAGLALVGADGPPRLGEASAVLALGRGRFEVLREGLTSIDDLRRTAGLAIGFVCTGNTCRSPMAEGLARAELARRLGSHDLAGRGFRVLSAGVFAGPGSPPSAHGVTALAQRGIDLSGHRSQLADERSLAGLDRVYCLTESHARALEAVLAPELAAAIELLDPQGRDVPDPVGGTLEHYLACAQAIEGMVAERARDWA